MTLEFVKIAVFVLLISGMSYAVGRLLYALANINVSALHIASSPILGLGTLATQLWVYGLVGVPWNRWLLVLPWVLLAVILRHRLKVSPHNAWVRLGQAKSKFNQLDNLSKTLLATGSVFAIAYFASLILQPFATSDILAIWGFKAKEFFINQQVYVTPRLTETVNLSRFYHIDYPPLLPLMADVFYVMLGHVNESIFKAMQVIFIVSGAASMFIFMRAFLAPRHKNLAAVFTFLLIAVPQFLPMLFQFKYMGYADYPLAILFLLSTLFLVRSIGKPVSSDWCLALVFASMAAVTKNEGLSFLGIVLLIMGVMFVAQVRKANPKTNRSSIVRYLVVAGALVLPTIVWAIYKQDHNMTVDFKFSNLAESGMNPIERLRTIFYYIWLYISTNPVFHWELAALVMGTAAALWYRSKIALLVLAVVGLQLTSYVLSFMFSPYDLKFHILSSIDRLLTQVLPITILLLSASLLTTSAKTKLPNRGPGRPS